MQRILATIAILAMAACGSAAQTGPKTTNPPLTADQKAKTGGVKPPIEVAGRTLKVNVLDFQMTMSESAWSGKLDQQEGGSIRLIFQRKDTGAVLLVIPVKAENETPQSIAESQVKAAQGQGLSPTAATDEGHGRYAFTVDSAATDPTPTRTYFSAMKHPTIKDAYLLFVATSAQKDSDAFLKEVRAMADSVSPIQ